MSELIEAIRAESTEAVITLLRAGADPNEIDDKDISIYVGPNQDPISWPRADPALICAIEKIEQPEWLQAKDQYIYPVDWLIGPHKHATENTSIVNALLDFGADVNSRNRRGEPALSIAAIQGKLAIVQCLLRRGANVNITDSNGNTCVHYACWNQQFVKAIVSELLKYGADINQSNGNGITPLMISLENKPGTVKMLLQVGADPRLADKEGHNALDRARTQKRHPQVLRLLEDAVNGKLLPSKKHK